MTSLDTVPLDVDFGHLLTRSHYSDRSRVGGGVGDVDDEGNNDRDNGLGGRWGGTEYYYGRRCENTVDSTVDDSIVVGEDEDDEDDIDDVRMRRRGDASSSSSYSDNDNDKKKNDDEDEDDDEDDDEGDEA